MTKVIKDNRTITVRDDIQLAAFLKSKWVKIDNPKPEPMETKDEIEDKSSKPSTKK